MKRRISISNKRAKDEAIFRTFLSSGLYKKSDSIMTYVSLPKEVDTHKIIQHALLEGKHVYVPKVISDKDMILCEITSFKDLKPGRKNILEPITNKEVEPSKAQLIIVPALGYTTSGYRLGYGSGYYDRLLSKVNCVTVGLCYEDCLFDSLPIEKHDVPVDFIITEEREIALWEMKV
jgi:5-formyltetrahydrofolate cyclo-ligase